MAHQGSDLCLPLLDLRLPEWVTLAARASAYALHFSLSPSPYLKTHRHTCGASHFHAISSVEPNADQQHPQLMSSLRTLRLASSLRRTISPTHRPVPSHLYIIVLPSSHPSFPPPPPLLPPSLVLFPRVLPKLFKRCSHLFIPFYCSVFFHFQNFFSIFSVDSHALWASSLSLPKRETEVRGRRGSRVPRGIWPFVIESRS